MPFWPIRRSAVSRRELSATDDSTGQSTVTTIAGHIRIVEWGSPMRSGIFANRSSCTAIERWSSWFLERFRAPAFWSSYVKLEIGSATHYALRISLWCMQYG